MLELLMSEWEDLLEDPEYHPVHDALRAGIALLEKYYRRADDTDAYFIAHGQLIYSFCRLSYCLIVLDPVVKLDYLNITWDKQYLECGMDQLKAKAGYNHSTAVQIYRFNYFSISFSFIRQSMRQLRRPRCQKLAHRVTRLVVTFILMHS